MQFDPTEAWAHAPEADRAHFWANRERDRNLGPGELGSSRSFWRSRRVIVTGCSDFLGAQVVERLEALGCRHIFVPETRDYDLTQQSDVRRLFADARADMVLHLAEQAGGILANNARPGGLFYENLMLGLLMIEEARRAGVGKFVLMGTICSYPKYTPVPFREEDLWNGYPDESNAPYGIAKRALLAQLLAYRKQYGFNGICVLPANLYGPRDNFHPVTSYVVPALVRRMVEAQEAGAEEVDVWGTGAASREFLYVDDCARGILLAAEHYEGPAPVNVGTGEEIKIRDLAALIAEVVGFRGRLTFNHQQPDGQPRRCVDTSKALQLFGFRAHTPLREGLEYTIDWYRRSRSRQAPDIEASHA
jgi:GDP-L-fucose synthase